MEDYIKSYNDKLEKGGKLLAMSQLDDDEFDQFIINISKGIFLDNLEYFEAKYILAEYKKNNNNNSSLINITTSLNNNKKYIIIVDSYFGSLEGAKKIMNDFYFIFGIKSNIDNEFKKPLYEKLKKNNWRNLYNVKNNLNYCVYHDRAFCSFLSNFRSGQKIIDEKPEVVYFYNKWMNAVDIFDSSLHLHYNLHRNKKWTHAYLYVLFKMAMTNAWIFYCSSNHSKITNTEFLELILKEGLTHFGKKQNNNKKIKHLIKYNSTKQKCKDCLKKGKSSNTNYYCSTCDVFLHAQCFAIFHEKKK